MASADILRAAHTKLPWSQQEDCETSIWAGGLYVAETYSGEEADAAFIVRACNAHYQMLEALKWFIDDIDGSHTSMTDFSANVARARAAIAAAEAEAGR